MTKSRLRRVPPTADQKPLEPQGAQVSRRWTPGDRLDLLRGPGVDKVNAMLVLTDLAERDLLRPVIDRTFRSRYR
jgi:hypothetical protein